MEKRKIDPVYQRRRPPEYSKQATTKTKAIDRADRADSTDEISMRQTAFKNQHKDLPHSSADVGFYRLLPFISQGILLIPLILILILVWLFSDSCYPSREAAWKACNDKYNNKCTFLGDDYKVCRN